MLPYDLSQESSQDLLAEDNQHVSEPPRLTRVYHPSLNGRICDASGHFIPPDSPLPAIDSDQGPKNWAPYKNRLQFEVADFLYRCNQMSGGNINFVLNLWVASLAIHDDDPPFLNAQHMYDTIDSTPLSDIPWESFTLQYDGPQPTENIPSWMDSEYNVWFWNPLSLVRNILSNPEFESGFDYSPFQERTSHGVH
ncbi:hypothetical protein EI94DRAFT_1802116 [Lactarius quietus]|nr:hypothetical protein EI94DRAFT_1802116 [Lactarius quietus]